MTIALLKLLRALRRYCPLARIKGARQSEANTKRKRVSDIGSMSPESFLETINERAIKNVAAITRKCALVSACMHHPFTEK